MTEGPLDMVEPIKKAEISSIADEGLWLDLKLVPFHMLSVFQGKE